MVGTADDVDPRIVRTRRVVLEAVLEELADVGYAGFTVESVAVRAGVGKSTIYRHWTGRNELVVDALQTLNVQPRPESAGAPQHDVVLLLRHLVEVLRDPVLGRCIPALIEAAERDPTVRDLLDTYTDGRRAALRDALARGVEDGSFPAHLDADVAAQALSGAVFYRRVMTATPMGTDEVDVLVRSVLGTA